MSNVDIIKALMDQELNDLHTAAPAKIEGFDPVRMVVEITLLYKYQGQQISKIIEVPVGTIKAGPFVIRPPYIKGDIVLVVFSERALDYILQAEPQDPQTGENVRHRIDDAIVICGLKLDSEGNLPTTNTNDLLIYNKTAGSKAVMTASGDIILEGNTIYLGDDAASEGVPLGTALKTWLDGHIHSSGGSGTPSTSSPSPSSKVKVI